MLRISSSRWRSPFFSSARSKSKERSKWSSTARLPAEVTMMTCSRPDAAASSTAYWMMGLSMSGRVSFGWALVAGRRRVPCPAARMTAFRTFTGLGLRWCKSWVAPF